MKHEKDKEKLLTVEELFQGGDIQGFTPKVDDLPMRLYPTEVKDHRRWLEKGYVSVREAISLAQGFEPHPGRDSTIFRCGRAESLKRFLAEVEEAVAEGELKLLDRHLYRILESTVILMDFLTWSIGKGFEPPPEFDVKEARAKALRDKGKKYLHVKSEMYKTLYEYLSRIFPDESSMQIKKRIMDVSGAPGDETTLNAYLADPKARRKRGRPKGQGLKN